jgi:hypothetical protein
LSGQERNPGPVNECNDSINNVEILQQLGSLMSVIGIYRQLALPTSSRLSSNPNRATLRLAQGFLDFFSST